MNEILADRQLRDLIERCERVFHALDATFEPTPEEFYDLAEHAMGALGEAAEYLTNLRETRHVAR
jgi:hypothetical protein